MKVTNPITLNILYVEHMTKTSTTSIIQTKAALAKKVSQNKTVRHDAKISKLNSLGKRKYNFSNFVDE